MSDDLIQQVEEWVQTSGNALELRVARSFGAAAKTGVHYSDAESGVLRETDVVVQRSYQYAADNNFNVTYVLECKQSTSPWVLFRTSSVYTQYAPFLQTFEPGSDEVAKQLGNEIERYPLLTPLPKLCNKIGTVHKSNGSTSSKAQKNEAWDAVRQVHSACRGLSKVRPSGANGPINNCLFVPVIVTTTVLAEVELAGDELQTTQVERSLLVMPQPPHGRLRAAWVCNESALPQLRSEIYADFPGIR